MTSYSSNGDGMRILSKNWSLPRDWQHRPTAIESGECPVSSGPGGFTHLEQRCPSWRIGRSIDPNTKPRDVPTEGPPQQGPADAGPPDGPGRQPGRAPSGRPRLSPSSHTD